MVPFRLNEGTEPKGHVHPLLLHQLDELDQVVSPFIVELLQAITWLGQIISYRLENRTFIRFHHLEPALPFHIEARDRSRRRKFGSHSALLPWTS